VAESITAVDAVTDGSPSVTIRGVKREVDQGLREASGSVEC